MKKLMILWVLLPLMSQTAFAGSGTKWVPIKGSCQIGQDILDFDFPSGNGSSFPVFRNGVALAVFVGPSESLVTDDKGINLIDINISAQGRGGNHLGTTIVRNLTANPKVLREFVLDLYDGTVMNCKF